jgi:hypothetical protein
MTAFIVIFVVIFIQVILAPVYNTQAPSYISLHSVPSHVGGTGGVGGVTGGQQLLQPHPELQLGFVQDIFFIFNY